LYLYIYRFFVKLQDIMDRADRMRLYLFFIIFHYIKEFFKLIIESLLPIENMKLIINICDYN